MPYNPLLTNYVCSFCGTSGVKLWRPVGTDSEGYCSACATKQAKLEDTIDDQGKIQCCWLKDTFGIVELSDQIYNPNAGKSLLPWVPTEDGFTWGYTSVPPDAVDWWRNLPTRLAKEPEDLRYDYQIASGNTITDQDVILDENGRFLGMYDHDFAKEYISYGEE